MISSSLYQILVEYRRTDRHEANSSHPYNKTSARGNGMRYNTKRLLVCFGPGCEIEYTYVLWIRFVIFREAKEIFFFFFYFNFFFFFLKKKKKKDNVIACS